MKKELFHGSKVIVEKPIYGFGNRHNDYGLGFYCTEEIELAKEWAIDSFSNGFVNKYEIDVSNLKILDLCDAKYNTLHWLTILIENRIFASTTPLMEEAKEYLLSNYSIPYHDFDLIIGYRADDSYFSFAKDFLNGSISYEQLSRAMRLGKLGKQVVLVSEESFKAIKYIGYVEVDKDIYYEKKVNRDKKARKEYLNVRKNKRQKGDLFINQIIDEEIKESDERLWKRISK